MQISLVMSLFTINHLLEVDNEVIVELDLVLVESILY
jgi:hypothetical protein